LEVSHPSLGLSFDQSSHGGIEFLDPLDQWNHFLWGWSLSPERYPELVPIETKLLEGGLDGRRSADVAHPGSGTGLVPVQGARQRSKA